MLQLTPTRVDVNRFANQVAALEADLHTHPPAPGGILFYSSSTMAIWRMDSLLRR